MFYHDSGPRIAHLRGGLRAYDLNNKEIRIGFDVGICNYSFPRPRTRSLISALNTLALEPYLIELITSDEQLKALAPRAVDFPHDLLCRREKDLWSSIRIASIKQRNELIADFAGRIGTYLELLSFRLREISDGYNRMAALVARNRSIESSQYYSNMFDLEVEAALHAFLADAGSLRDTLAEACWRLFEGGERKRCSTMGELCRRKNEISHPTTKYMLQAGAIRGWLKNLSDIRDKITHVAPLRNVHEISSWTFREYVELGQRKIFRVHFPLANKDGSLNESIPQLDHLATDEEIEARFRICEEFSKNSMDAFDFCFSTACRLLDLSKKIREDAGLFAEPPRITEKDIIELKKET